MRFPTLLTMSLAALSVLSAAACDRGFNADATTQHAGPKSYPFTVVTTVGMVRDVVQQVAGDKATARGLIGSGVDPHLYKPTRSDIAALLEADVVFYSGLMLEGKMADTFVKLSREGKPVFAVTETIDESLLLSPPELAGHYDPHVWMDVSRWMKAVDAVAESLATYDPANASTYRENAKRYLTELARLHEYASKSIGSIPQKQRVLITAHDAFNYFGDAYDIEVRGIQGLSTESEAGLQDINRLVQFIVDNDVKAVFVESSVAEKNVRALIDGAKARGKEVKIGGTLFSDAMGAEGTYEGTYVGMIDHNVTTITRALGGEAPEKGMQGKLN
ncbi:MAG TPA: zinc ABC transporter substrate-binding protein [Tepidisphaeraceae bacterium]|nr:zinc ABC transporter substrate-binding protein [Tepidisphaeraceae bacterium]